MKVTLKLNPKLMMYERIEAHKIEVGIAKGITKARYALMDADNEDTNDASSASASDENEQECEVYDFEIILLTIPL